MLPSDIMKLRTLFYSNIYPVKKGEAPSNTLLEIINKYSTLGIQEPLPSEVFWLGMFDKGIIDKEEIQASLLKSTYFKDEKTPEWVTLWHFFDLTDDEFEKTFRSVIEEYKNIKYDDIGVIKHVTGMFLWLSDIGIYDKDKSQIISELQQYIDSLISNKALNHTEQLRETVFELDSYGGLGFFGNNLPEFKEMCEYINKSLDSVKIESMPNAGSDLLIMMQSDFQKFSKMVRHSNSEDQIFYDTPIFKYIDPMEFVRAYLSLLPKFRRKISAIFIKRYEFDTIAERLIDERDWLKSVRDILSEEATARKGTVSGYVTSSFVDSCLNKIITNLEGKAANQEAGTE